MSGAGPSAAILRRRSPARAALTLNSGAAPQNQNIEHFQEIVIYNQHRSLLSHNVCHNLPD